MNRSQSTNTPEYLNQKQLEKLAQDPKNKVYTYVNDDPTARFTVNEQKRYTAQIRNEYTDLRQKFPDHTDKQLREEIRKNKTLDLFAENNTRIFDLLTSRESKLDEINHIRYMLYLREQQELGNIDTAQAQAMIQDYLITAFKTNMTPKEYEEKMKATQPKKKNVKEK